MNNEYALNVLASRHYNESKFNFDHASKEEIDTWIEDFVSDAPIMLPGWEFHGSNADKEYLRNTMRDIVYRRVILVGRHVSDLPSYVEVVAQENIMWSLNREECALQLEALMEKAAKEKAAILLQNCPGILLATMARIIMSNQGLTRLFGVVISVPGPRFAGASETFQISQEEARTLETAVLFANGRAKTEIGRATVTVTVDPVSEFKFDHIEWF